jgi:hypothetical protein
MFDLLCPREMTSARRELEDARHVWESDNAGVGETDTLLACSLERRACHRPCTWRRMRDAASVLLARV